MLATSRYMIQFESSECGSSPQSSAFRVHSYQCLSHSVRPTLRLHPCRGALLTDLARVRNFGDRSGEKSIAIHLYSHVQVWKSFIYLLQISDIFLAFSPFTKPILIFQNPKQASQPVRGRLLFQSLMGPQLLFFCRQQLHPTPLRRQMCHSFFIPPCSSSLPTFRLLPVRGSSSGANTALIRNLLAEPLSFALVP